jgi:hypothetical protein
MKAKQLAWLVLALAATVTLCGCGTDTTWKHQAFAFTVAADPPTPIVGTNIVALGRITVSPEFASHSFTYRTGENTYVKDPYAGFITSPEHALAGPMRDGLRRGGAFGDVLDSDSALIPSVVVEASVTKLYGDFRKPAAPLGTMGIHFIVYKAESGEPGRILLDKMFAHEQSCARRTPEALVAAWEADFRAIMDEFNSEYAKAHSDDR